MLHDRLQVIHVHIPKTGGTSVQAALFPLRKKTFHQAAGRFPTHKWAAYFTFAFVRDPYERTASHYAYHVESDYAGKLLEMHPDLKSLSFEAYLRRFVVPRKLVNFFSQKRYVVHPKSDVPIDFLGRFERLEEDFARLTDRLGRSAKLPHLKRSEHRPYDDYYSETPRRLVAEAYADDFEYFGYTT